MTSIDSQQVSWWPVHEFVTELVAQYNDLPVAGTPRWCAMSAADPRKLIALAVAGEHHALRMEISQEARCEASKSVAESADWSAVGKGRGSAYVKRVTA